MSRGKYVEWPFNISRSSYFTHIAELSILENCRAPTFISIWIICVDFHIVGILFIIFRKQQGSCFKFCWQYFIHSFHILRSSVLDKNSHRLSGFLERLLNCLFVYDVSIKILTKGVHCFINSSFLVIRTLRYHLLIEVKTNDMWNSKVDKPFSN